MSGAVKNIKNTIHRKFSDIAGNIRHQLKSIISIFDYYYGVIHKSTDARNYTQLNVLILRYDVS